MWVGSVVVTNADPSSIPDGGPLPLICPPRIETFIPHEANRESCVRNGGIENMLNDQERESAGGCAIVRKRLMSNLLWF